jgi:hypothetical protein
LEAQAFSASHKKWLLLWILWKWKLKLHRTLMQWSTMQKPTLPGGWTKLVSVDEKETFRESWSLS